MLLVYFFNVKYIMQAGHWQKNILKEKSQRINPVKKICSLGF